MSESTIDKRRGVTRRGALGLAGLAGAAYVAGPLKGLGGSSAAAPQAAAAATCVVAPEVTEGPYWVDVKQNRSDVREGQGGVPLTLNLYVYRSDDSCEPEQGAIVDIWHCNSEGLYSDEAANHTEGAIWLRGYQETNASGLASFTTVFPGWYSGRAVHIHVRVRTFSGTATTYNFTTQIFFNESDIEAVLATSPYDSRSSSGRMKNTSDMIYEQEVTAGNVLQPTLSGSASAGYTGTVGIGLSGLPATASGAGSGSSSGSSGSSGSSSSGSGSGSSSAGDSTVEAKLAGRRFESGGGRRDLALKIQADERVAASARVMRGGRAVAHKEIAAMRGTKTMAVPFGEDVAAGPARLELTLTDRAGNSRVIRRRLRVPAA